MNAFISNLFVNQFELGLNSIRGSTANDMLQVFLVKGLTKKTNTLIITLCLS